MTVNGRAMKRSGVGRRRFFGVGQRTDYMLAREKMKTNKSVAIRGVVDALLIKTTNSKEIC